MLARRPQRAADLLPLQIRNGKRKKKERPMVDWVRAPQQRTARLTMREGRGDTVVKSRRVRFERQSPHARRKTVTTSKGTLSAGR
jgi:hypothetical protein